MIGYAPSWSSEASAHAAHVDWLFGGFLILALILSAPVFVLTIFFAFRYRRGRKVNRRHAPDRNVLLEVSWAGIPFLLMIGFYVWATDSFMALQHPPADALNIDVVAKQWMWKFQHPGGQAEINALHVPAGQAVVLTLASQDVIHSLFIPALRIKQDAVPGRYTRLWFDATKVGTYAFACAEFCGTDHSIMGGQLVVMKPADYSAWLAQSGVDGTLAEQGAALFRTRGCSGCHGPSATVHAPSLEGLYGSPVPLQDGSVVTADAEYIRDSILLPQSAIAAGYPAIMPTFQNILSEDEVLKLVAYIESLGTKGGSEP